MSKKANTNIKLNPLIAGRWSPRSFSDKKIEKEKIIRLLEAARWAASSSNEQPWRFIIGEKGSDAFAKIADTLADSNRLWAAKAPLLILTAASSIYTKWTSANRHALHDVGLAVGNLTIQAAADDLYLHQMGGFSIEKAINNFKIPEGYEPVTVIACGYLGEPENLPEELSKRETLPRTRKELKELVFSNVWGESSEIVKKE